MELCIKSNSNTKLVLIESDRQIIIRVLRPYYSFYIGSILIRNQSIKDIGDSLKESYKDIDLSKSDRDLIDYLLDNSTYPIHRRVFKH